MVHKKSEYALNYHIFQKDMNERRRIWQDNIKCRESLRSLNRADHYWSFQVSENCTWDNGAEKEEEEEDVDNLVPHKIKHKALLAKYSSNQSTKIDGLLWSSDENTLKKKNHTETNEGKTNQTYIEPTPRCGQEIGVQTPNWHNDDLAADSNQEIKELGRIMSLNTISDKVTPVRPFSPIPVGKTSEIGRPLTVADLIPDCPIIPSTHSLGASRPGHSAGSSKFLGVLTRTKRRAFLADKMSPFASYGWNNEVKSMGGKKTHNISAPEGEVYKHAGDTQRRRHEEVQSYLQEEAACKRRMRGTHCSSVVNHSSIWRSEYQDRFTPERSSKRNLRGKCVRSRSVSAVRPISSIEWYRENG